MKTAKQWIEEISKSGEGHECACICARCKNGKETFLLESDIIKIQADAFANAAKIATSTQETIRLTGESTSARLIGSERPGPRKKFCRDCGAEIPWPNRGRICCMNCITKRLNAPVAIVGQA